MTDPAAPIPPAAGEALPAPRLLVNLSPALAGGALLLDAAVETYRAGSPVRWWIVASAACYLAGTAATWRRPIGWKGRLAAAALVLLALVAGTAWLPGGLDRGLRMLGQPTPTIVAALVAIGVALAGYELARWKGLPLAARAVVGLLAAYGVSAFAAAALTGTPLDVLFSGASLWQRLPRFLQGAWVGGLLLLPLGLVWALVNATLRRPAAASARAAWWKVIALTAGAATVAAGVPMTSRQIPPAPMTRAASLAASLGLDPAAPKLSDAELETALTNSLRAIEDGERDAPRDRWDPAWVAAQLGPDPARIFAWVRQSTSWVPYHGVLRGPVGVLLDRSGNSLDRALLLATLLRHANQMVRVAHAALPREHAGSVLATLLLPRASAPETAGPDDALASVAAEYRLDAGAVRRTVIAQAESWARRQGQSVERARDQARRLAEAVGRPAGDLKVEALEKALGAAQDHWWVQVLQSNLWVDYDLLGDGPGTSLAMPDSTFDPEQVPDDLHHRVTIRVVGERWDHGTLGERVILNETMRVARHIGKPIALRFLPAMWPSTFPPPNTTPQQGLRSLALEQHEWTPVLVVGQTPYVQFSIRDTGDLAAGPQTTGGGSLSKFGQALEDALKTPGPPQSPPQAPPPGSPALSAAWIEYEISAPGDQPRKTRRALFDLIGPAGRAGSPAPGPRLDETDLLTRSLALIRETQILPVVSRITPEYVTHLAAESLLANKQLLLAGVRGTLPDGFAGAQELASKLVPMPTPLYGLALARFEWSRFGELIHIDRPNILTRHTFIAPAQRAFRLVGATDIVSNDIGVNPLVNDSFSVRLEQGVLDTNVEAILASERPDASNAGWAYASGSQWATIRSSSDSAFASLRLPDDVRKRIADELGAGYLVVAPTAPVPIGAEAFAGWWRVDPGTGQSLGMGSAGWGQAMTEFLITVGWALAIAWMFEYLLCKMLASSEGLVAQGCEPTRGRAGTAILEWFVTPAHAAGDGCVYQALIAGALGGLLGVAGGLGKLVNAGPKSGSADPFAKTQADPFAKTDPGGFGAGGQSGPSGGNPAGGSGTGGTIPSAGGGPTQGSPAHKAAIEANDAAYAKYWKATDPAEKATLFEEWRKALFEMNKLNASPENKEFFSPQAQGGGSSGGTQTVPQGPGTPSGTAPAGPGGTQIMKGPGQTQIMKGPGQTQKIPQTSCPGPACPPTAQQKTLTGLGGVANALGQKVGGGS